MNRNPIDKRILYEDNHLIVVNKWPGEIVQGDKTGDEPLSESVKKYIKEKYNKPGNVFLGVTHRLDRPTSGAVIFAKTSKALERINKMLREHQIKKKYWAVIEGIPQPTENRLEHYLKKNPKTNKTIVFIRPAQGAKQALLTYKTIKKGDKYALVEVDLLTGRHHQIRAQLAKTGHPVKGDLKYGAKRSLKNGGIMLHARQLEFVHPVKKTQVNIIAPPLTDDWKMIELMDYV